jgi:uncharacterized membrane protein (UPF0127 family)
MNCRTSALALALVLVADSQAFAATCHADRAPFHGRGQTIEIAVEIADDPAERARGLMFRQELLPGQGMLFVYEHPQQVSFWMRNTLIPLDMIFIDPRGEVRHIHPMARPRDETPIPGAAAGDPAPERLMVLEVAGGDAARLGITPGMILSHPLLPQATALSPCS